MATYLFISQYMKYENEETLKIVEHLFTVMLDCTNINRMSNNSILHKTIYEYTTVSICMHIQTYTYIV